jgi:transforming growth factor-beta-induced protein
MSYSIIKKIATLIGTVAILAGFLISPVVYAATGDIVDVASNASQFSTLVAAVKAADLVSTLQGSGPFTVVAPTNTAFEALPAGVLSKLLLPVNKPELVKILKYHVVSGNNNSTALTTVANSASPTNEVATVEGSKLKFTVSDTSLKINANTTVTAANISATNGIIHQIDTVLLPPTFSVSSLKDEVSNNIVQTAVAAPSFSTLVAAVKAAGLVDTLSGTGPFTVFAPTNDAFAKVPADVLAKLLLPENKDALVKVLTYHVVAGKVDASQVVKLTSAKTVQGSDVKIAVVDGKVKLNDTTTVLTTDIQASNGIVHSIDSVLLPADLDLTKLVSAKTVEADHSKGEHTVRTGGANLSIVTLIITLISIVSLGFATKSVLSKIN